MRCCIARTLPTPSPAANLGKTLFLYRSTHPPRRLVVQICRAELSTSVRICPRTPGKIAAGRRENLLPFHCDRAPASVDKAPWRVNAEKRSSADASVGKKRLEHARRKRSQPPARAKSRAWPDNPAQPARGHLREQIPASICRDTHPPARTELNFSPDSGSKSAWRPFRSTSNNRGGRPRFPPALLVASRPLAYLRVSARRAESARDLASGPPGHLSNRGHRLAVRWKILHPCPRNHARCSTLPR